MKNLLNQIKELSPIKTETEPQLASLSHIKCVLFDIYGTLLISDSGDIGSTQLVGKSALQAFNYCGIKLTSSIQDEDAGKLIISVYKEKIHDSHNISKAKGVLHPEVDILSVWKNVITELKEGHVIVETQEIDLSRLASAFEFYNNSVYPMPKFKETLNFLHASNTVLGVISNAQFFTPKFVNHFAKDDFESSELPWFDPELILYSYEFGKGKPDIALYEQVRTKVLSKGISAEECLFVGNDMLNDIYPANKVGFKTALFAGDKRSLRLREEHDHCKNLKPDCTITQLDQLSSIIGLN